MPTGMTQPAVLIRLRPTGPWRYGPGDGAHDRVDSVYRSDRVFSAVTVAMEQLGFLEEWLNQTARASQTAVAFTSLYPYQGDTLFATPPASVWPPPPSQLTAPNPAFLNKIRWNEVRLVPLTVIEALLTGRTVPADQWIADAATGCLLRRERPGSAPFRVAIRTAGAVDRVTRSSIQVSSAACVEFEPDSGLWTVARYRDGAAASAWQDRLHACFRLLADSGFGGRRTHGWGKTESPDWKRGTWPGIILPRLGRNSGDGGEPEASLYWLLSLYSPAAGDRVDWSGGDYQLTLRGGRVESPAAGGALKKNARMIAEGSVLAAKQEPMGAAVDVAPDGFAHPVYRSGFALTLKLPVIRAASDLMPVETPSDEEALEPRPCEEPPALVIADVNAPREETPVSEERDEEPPQREEVQEGAIEQEPEHPPASMDDAAAPEESTQEDTEEAAEKTTQNTEESSSDEL